MNFKEIMEHIDTIRTKAELIKFKKEIGEMNRLNHFETGKYFFNVEEKNAFYKKVNDRKDAFDEEAKMLLIRETRKQMEEAETREELWQLYQKIGHAKYKNILGSEKKEELQKLITEKKNQLSASA